jgi:chromosome segregation ATPase
MTLGSTVMEVGANAAVESATNAVGVGGSGVAGGPAGAQPAQGTLQGRNVKFFPHWSSYMMVFAVAGGVAVVVAGVFLESYIEFSVIGGAMVVIGVTGFFAIKSFAPVHEWEKIAAGYKATADKVEQAYQNVHESEEKLQDAVKDMERLQKEKKKAHKKHKEEREKFVKDLEAVNRNLEETANKNLELEQKMEGLQTKFDPQIQKLTVENNRLQKYTVELLKVLNEIDKQGENFDSHIQTLEQDIANFDKANQDMRSNVDFMKGFNKRTAEMTEHYKKFRDQNSRMAQLVKNFDEVKLKMGDQNSEFAGTVSKLEAALAKFNKIAEEKKVDEKQKRRKLRKINRTLSQLGEVTFE